MSTHGLERRGWKRCFGYRYILHSQPTPDISPDMNLSPHPAAYFFFGGLLMIIGSIGEWIVGNTFPFVVFGTFGKPPLPPRHISVKSTADTNPFLPSRCLLAHLRRHPCPLLQLLRRLRHIPRTNGRSRWKPRKPTRVADPGVQR